ncbi:hypothetical protein KUTeg_008007 [Tegillarca granosa]|uniref:Heat shock 70 kDa protein 12A n=1 Tax=Tegillarca granosa TaxID=220873 RepID=A0ABQ9FH61_TEGGR|nr:hypothetical protein KUTeg_008007 [Tegillarca granosa]
MLTVIDEIINDRKMGNCLQRQTNAQDTVPTQNDQFTTIYESVGGRTSPPPPYQQYNESSTTQPQQPSSERLLVAAIDFGTAFSGYAFSFRHDYEVDPLKISCNLWQHNNGLSNKAPTSVLFGPDGQVDSFGYDADLQFANVVQEKDVNNWHYFDRFKMRLFKEKDISGKEMKAIDVFSGTIGYIKNHLLARLKGMDTAGHVPERRIHWIITVPAIWNDKAKFFMRKSAEQAGIPKEQLTLALEPEAASLFCRYLPTFQYATKTHGNSDLYQPLGTGAKYMILDLGGGTADFTVHEVLADGTLQELHQASGGYWGGTTVDKKFLSVMKSVFGDDTIRQFRNQHPRDMLELQTDFEIKKRTFTSDRTRDVNLKIPLAFVEVYEETSGGRKVADAVKQSQYHDKIEIRRDKMVFKPELFSAFFEESILCILSHIQKLLQKPELSDVTIILLVGGYSESPIIKTRIINTYPNLRVVHPDDSGLAILKGAVLFGHEPQAISSRICKYTYGIAMTLPFKEGVHPEEKRRIVGDIQVCDDIFDIHVRIGQKMQIGMEQPEKEYCLFRGQTKGILDTFASLNTSPRFVSEDGCTHLGRIIIEKDEDSENSRRIFVKILYCGTELVVEARNDTGKIIKAYYDFLGR